MTDGKELGSGEAKLETYVSRMLIVCVAISVVLESIGLAMYFGAYGNTQVSQSPNVYISGHDFFSFIATTVQNLFVSQNAVLFMTLGLIFLILTPYIRAVTSVVYFAWTKNAKYVAITAFVLIVLTISLIIH